MVIQISTQTEYVPEWHGNKESTKPIVVKHKTPSMNLYEELIAKPTLKVLIKDGETTGGETEVTVDNASFFKRMVNEIENFELEVDGKKVTIEKASDCFGPSIPAVVSGFIDEVGSYLNGLLAKKDFDAKN